MARTHNLGKQGEELVAELLQKRGWQIMARNWRRPGAELDLIARRGEQILFVEVKTRRSLKARNDMAQILPWRKLQILRRSTNIFLTLVKPEGVKTVRLYLALVSGSQDAQGVSWVSLEGETYSELGQSKFYNEKTPPSLAGYFSGLR